MNTNLLGIIKRLVAEQGESILCEPKRLYAFLADLARDEPKPHKNALIKCLEHGFVQALKEVPESERPVYKQRLARKLHEEEGLVLELCAQAVELLAAALFGEEQEKIFCHCGKELQEDWKICPYCGSGTVPAGISAVAAQTGQPNWRASAAAGKDYTIAVRKDGSLWAWGSNGSGRLGDGKKTDRSSPVRVTGI